MLFILGTICLAFMAPAFASKDDLYISNINAVTVGGSPVAHTSTSNSSNIRQLTITHPIVGSQAVSVQVTWGIAAGNNPRTTSYPKPNVGFTGANSGGTNVGAINISPAICDFSSASSTCSSTITFTTPNVTDSNIQVKIEPTNTGSGNSSLLGKNLFVNFSVIAQVAKLDTALTVPDPQCFMYKSGDANLTATLTELLSHNSVSGGQVDFSIDSNPIGSDFTDDNGDAILTYNINGLSAGDHNLFAEFAGDTMYNPSDNSATVGISYNFAGFKQPINADGTSVFGNGRVLPIKIQLTDGNLQPVPDAAPTVWMTQVSPLTALGSDLEPATSVSSADTGNTMRYVAADDQYIFNWDLSTLSNGTWYVVVDLGDSDACSKGPYYATITVNKKKGK